MKMKMKKEQYEKEVGQQQKNKRLAECLDSQLTKNWKLDSDKVKHLNVFTDAF